MARPMSHRLSSPLVHAVSRSLRLALVCAPLLSTAAACSDDGSGDGAEAGQGGEGASAGSGGGGGGGGGLAGGNGGSAGGGNGGSGGGSAGAASADSMVFAGVRQPSFFVKTEGKMYFRAAASAGDRHTLWVLDGPGAAPREVAPSITRGFEQLGGSSETDVFFAVPPAFGGKFLFTKKEPGANRQLYVTDGTDAGTIPLAEVNAAGGMAQTGTHFFFHKKSQTDFAEEGIWVTDGTPAGTRMIKEGPKDKTGIYANGFAWGNKAYFYWTDISGPVEFWASDGTAAGTQKLSPGDKNFDTPPVTTAPVAAVFKERLYFAYGGPEPAGQPTRTGLWVTDGTPAGTQLLKHTYEAGSSRPQSFRVVGDRLVFASLPPTGVGHVLWSTDGTAAGTVQLTTEFVDWDDTRLPEVNGKALFNAAAVLGQVFDAGSLWATDGTKNGTTPLASVRMLSGYHGKVGQDRMVFFADPTQPQKENELWVTDGTPSGTTPLVKLDISAPNNIADRSSYLYPVGSRVYFTARDASNLKAVYETDGTAAGTRALPVPPDLQFFKEPILFGDTFFVPVTRQGATSLDDTYLYRYDPASPPPAGQPSGLGASGG